jgi:hypothetical protein
MNGHSAAEADLLNAARCCGPHRPRARRAIAEDGSAGVGVQPLEGFGGPGESEGGGRARTLS